MLWVDLISYTAGGDGGDDGKATVNSDCAGGHGGNGGTAMDGNGGDGGSHCGALIYQGLDVPPPGLVVPLAALALGVVCLRRKR